MMTDLKKDIIYRRIKELIISGFYPMGAKISEGMLEHELQGNKAPIRDALKRLAAEKLVDRKAKSGTYVFSLNSRELDEMLHFRYVIESEASLLSMRFEPDLLMQEIGVVIERMRECMEDSKIGEYLRLDSRFHELLVSHCENRYFIESFSNISAIMDTVRNCLGSNTEHLERSFKQHLEIAKAINARDVHGFTEVYRAHLLSECGSYWSPDNLQNKIQICD